MYTGQTRYILDIYVEKKCYILFIITVLGENRNQPPNPYPCSEPFPSKNYLD